jgi:glycosyltransferase involved in cell wall biosynthesis
VSESLIQQAQLAFQGGKYGLAVDLYQQAMAQQPELAHLYAFGLQRARARLGVEAPMAPQATGEQKNAVTLADLWREADAAASALPPMNTDQCPTVSVLMTAHNVAQYVEQAAVSVLRQSWPKLELVIVDDASTDSTWAVLRRLARTDARVQIRRLNTNLGTYFAKNLALTMARGQVVFFQDGDDICHPHRIRLGMHALHRSPNAVCVRGAYARVMWPSGQVLPVNGEVRRLGLITLGVRREVFAQLGVFNATTKASDEEFFTRLQQAYAGVPGAVVNVPVSTYYNTLREGSLFADMVANDPARDGRIDQVPSPSRQAYVETFKRYHRQSAPQEWARRFRFPVLRDVLPVAPDMTGLSNPVLPVVVSLCSIPERADLLRKTLASLAPQCDAMHVYLDRYDHVPDFVQQCHPKVTVVRSQQVPGLRDNGKFLPLLALAEPCYFFTCDDDILYPPDYVHTLVRKMEHYGRRAAIGVHGVLVPQEPQGYFTGYRKVFHFAVALEQDQLVNNLGTGTAAFYSGLLNGMDHRQFEATGMVDLCVAGWCRRQGVPMVAVARHERWLYEMANDAPNLFDEFAQADTPQTRLMQKHAPWGYRAIEQALARLPQGEAAQRLHKLLPDLRDCLR